MNTDWPNQKRHLRRLERVWLEAPVYFITVCTHDRKAVLSTPDAMKVVHEVWTKSLPLYGWRIGDFVVMPDHVHFFCAADSSAKPLSHFIGKWKEWTAKYLNRRHGIAMPLWQAGFFDHVLRSEESYSEKWEYVRQNPVRAGLVQNKAEWPYAGTIHRL